MPPRTSKKEDAISQPVMKRKDQQLASRSSNIASREKSQRLMPLHSRLMMQNAQRETIKGKESLRLKKVKMAMERERETRRRRAVTRKMSQRRKT
jgi:hypothetical protein